ncbi:MAG: CHAD domain-containing protein [Candidatus Dormiibacterota bacterium]
MLASREFVADAAISDAALIDLVGGQGRIKREPPQVVHREWFDTFDWRLRRAGLSLERATVAGDARAELLLRRTSGEVLQVVPVHPAGVKGGGQRLVLAGDGSVGSVRARLAPVVQMRALLALVGVTVTVRTFSVLDADAKTVARIVVEEPSRDTRNTLSAPISRVTAVAVRGYEGEARKLARRLSTLAALRPSCESCLDAALAEAGRRAGDYTGQLDLTLSPTQSAGTAVQIILLRLLAVAERNMPGIKADLDTEFLHDLRVAVRRARTALKLLGDLLPPDQVESLLLDLKWMSDLTTPTRDLDAHRLIPDHTGARGSQPEELRPFQAFLLARRQLARQKLLRGLRSARWSRARQRWSSLCTSQLPASEEHSRALGDQTVEAVARPRIARAYRRARRLGEAITAASPASDLHALRKRCKELRYLMEFFGSVLENRSYRAVLRQLKSLQDCLGEFQDTYVQILAVKTFADEMVAEGAGSAATLMALGRTVDALELRQAQARQEFGARFRRFANKSTRAHLTALTEDHAQSSPSQLRDWR